MSDVGLLQPAASPPGAAPMAPPAPRRGWFAWPLALARFVWKWLAGAVLCYTFLGSILVVGWSYRLGQRTAFKWWWRRSNRHQPGARFSAACQSGCLAGHARWPNWVVDQRAAERLRSVRQGVGMRQAACSYVAATLGSLWLNARLGAAGIFNTWVLTIPACALWLVSWYAGWNNSFHKGYEQAHVGPLVGVAGIALFIAAMFYVPMAQARQAATGYWRTFYDFPLVWRLVRRRWSAPLCLAVLYTLASLPLTVLKMAPAVFPQAIAGFDDYTTAQVVQLLTVYYLSACALVFPLFVLLRIAAARMYARSLLALVAEGTLSVESLDATERQVLEELQLVPAQTPRRHPLVRAVKGTWRITAGTALAPLIAIIWFTFVAQIYVAAFFNYQMAQGWLNQPLVQLPWFNYIPPHLFQ